jgi:hypothetical protein
MGRDRQPGVRLVGESLPGCSPRRLPGEPRSDSTTSAARATSRSRAASAPYRLSEDDDSSQVALVVAAAVGVAGPSYFDLKNWVASD